MDVAQPIGYVLDRAAYDNGREPECLKMLRERFGAELRGEEVSR
jgi:hypothetical protein